MKSLLKLEYMALFALSIVFFWMLQYPWWWYPVLFLLPDIGMIGYLVSPKIGARTYNATHHLGTAVFLFILGKFLGESVLLLAGTIVLGHNAFDRALGYGLKYPDSFKHTHLGNL